MALEVIVRSNNLILVGVKEVSAGDNCVFDVKRLFSTPLDLENSPPLSACYRLGKLGKSRGSVGRPIMVVFHSKSDRDHVWSLRKKLSGTSISMKEDFPYEIANARKVLYKIMKLARQLGRRAYLRLDSLIIDSKEFSIATLKGLPDDVKAAMRSAANRELADDLLGFSIDSPLSIFFPVHFELGGETFDSVDQFLQIRKALHCGKPEEAGRMRDARGPRESKRIGDSLKPVDLDRWHQDAIVAIKEACKAKFTQDLMCRDFLLSTGRKKLCECSYRKFWATGFPINDKRNCEPDLWTGQNKYGQILMEIRSELAAA